MRLQDLAGHDLGTRAVGYDERDAILYALAVGAPAARTDLVYERELRVLPAYACALGLWAVEQAGGLGAYDRARSLHAAQTLELHAPLPPRAEVATRGRVAAVWDKGKAALVEVEVESDLFTARYAIFLPGRGGWGGDRGPATPRPEPPGADADWRGSCPTRTDQAALYRLTGDRHPIHVDVEVARANGFDRPILHGLCTFGIAARELAAAVGAHPAQLRRIEARLAAPVLPGDEVVIAAARDAQGVRFEAKVGQTAVLTGGRAVFDRPA